MKFILLALLVMPTIACATPKNCKLDVMNYRSGKEYTYTIPFEEFDNEESARLFAQGNEIPINWIIKNTYAESDKVTWDVYLQEPPPGQFQCYQIES